MTIHDDAESARRAVYDTAFGKLQASIDGLTLEKATLTGTVQELEARIKELETKPAEPTPAPNPPTPLPKTIFGPTGEKWASNTPKPNEATSTYMVEGTWKAIAEGIQRAAAGSDYAPVVRVRGGVLPGYGAGATSTPVLQNINASRPGGQKILVVPDAGMDSVTFTGSLRMHGITNVAFMGFQLGEQYGIVPTGCQDFSWGFSNSRFWNITNSGSAKTKNIEFIECVCTDLGPLTSTDRSAFRNADSGTIDGVLIDGCYYAPVYKAQGESAHLDMLQLSGGGRFDNIVIRDTAGFAASNQGLIVTPTTTITLDHTLIVGGPSVHERYPRQAGAYVQQYEGSPWPLNGAPGGAAIKNGSVLVGSVKGWANAQYDATSGALATVDKAYLDANAPVPTLERRREMWSKII